MNFKELQNRIIAWFWKMGYKLGNAVGLIGKGIVDEAFSSGFRDTAFETIDMKTLLDNLESSYDDEFASMADFTSVSAASDLGSLEFKDVFVELFEEHFASAHSVFTSNEWFVDFGGYTNPDAPDAWISIGSQDDGASSHARYRASGTDADGNPINIGEIIIQLSRNADGSISNENNIVIS